MGNTFFWLLNRRYFRAVGDPLRFLGALEGTKAEICEGAPSILWKICQLTV